jgi:CheY-like chemotaxis protein
MARSEHHFFLASNEQDRDSTEASRKDGDSQEPGPTPLRILVVDDEQLLADTTVEILASFGFDAKAAYDGESALGIAISFRPDFLLTDVLMPRMNGVELAIFVRKQLPKTRILLFSGQAGITELLMRGREQGYEFELVAKPIHPVKLVEHIKKMQLE